MRPYALVLFFGLFFSCATEEIDYKTQFVTEETSTKDALEIAIVRGGSQIERSLRIVNLRKAQDFAKDLLTKRLSSREGAFSFTQKANMIGLLQSFNLKPHEAILLFETLKSSLYAKQRELAWGVATAFPSVELGVHIEKHLSQALLYNDLDRELVPAMADALAQNELSSSYSILKQGLSKTNNSAFAQAMIKLDPSSAEKDFLDYLSTIPLEELRQLNLESSDIFLCLEILDFILRRNPPPTHPKYKNLFYFAVSRNQSLSDYAVKIIEKASFHHRSHLAEILSSTDDFVQVAYIEKARRKKTIQTKLLLKELKKYSSKDLVLNEIDNFLR